MFLLTFVEHDLLIELLICLKKSIRLIMKLTFCDMIHQMSLIAYKFVKD